MAVFFIAVYGLVTSENLVRKIMCLNIIEGMIIFLFIKAGYVEEAVAPILKEGLLIYVDPVPQALMLTAIVVGVCFNSLALSIIIKIYQKRGTVNVGELYED
ncbi:MAG: sodium:proton antiporter [Candidatus Muiribacteriota bacterium]